MTPAFNQYDRITALGHDDKNVYFTNIRPVKNSYSSTNTDIIPAFSVMRVEFGCDSGLYAILDTGTATTRCKIAPEEYDPLVFLSDIEELFAQLHAFLFTHLR